MTREEKIEGLIEVQAQLIGQFNFLADILDLYKNEEKFESALNGIIKNKDMALFYDCKNHCNYGLNAKELFYFKGLLFIKAALNVLDDYVDGRLADIDFLAVFSTGLFYGTSVSAWATSKIDLDNLTNKQHYSVLLSKVIELEDLAKHSEKFRANGGWNKKTDDEVEKEREKWQTKINEMMKRRGISYTSARANILRENEGKISSATLHRIGVRKPK